MANYHYADPSQLTTLTGQNRGGSNAWLWQPTEQNTKYSDYLFGGQNNYMTGEVARYLQALGYGGNAPQGGEISDQDAQGINAFLSDLGLRVQTGTHQVPGASQHTGIQRIIDANGNPVAVDARNNRYDGNDRLTDLAKAAAVAAGGYYAFGGIPGLGEIAGGTSAGMEGSIFDLLGSKEMGAIGSGIGSAGTTLGDIASGIGSLVGGPKGIGSVVAPILGAIGGAADAKKPDTMTQDRKMDPRMDAFVYGTGPGDTNSLLGAAQQWFNQNRSGTNADMTAGMDMLRSLYTSPQYQQGYNNMRNVGQGLMNITPAGNPFTQGLLQTPQMGNPFGGQGPNVNLGGLLQPRTFG